MENFITGAYFNAVLIVTMVIVFYAACWRIEKNARKKVSTPAVPEPVYDIVGKSHSVFLAPLVVEPFMSDKLETEMKSDAVSEPEIQSNEVEANLGNSEAIDANELDDFSEHNVHTEGDLSQGLTFEQISHAIDVIEGKKSGERDEYFAGMTFSFMPDDFINAVCMQADREAMVKKLIAGYVDFPDKMKPKPVVVTDFDINKYV
jgi:hypothetical protein